MREWRRASILCGPTNGQPVGRDLGVGMGQPNMMNIDPESNRRRTQGEVRYVPRRQATPSTYQDLGFRCGLEIHQQLKTAKKLFCRCPAGIYQHSDAFDAQLVRHMRPTLSELGEYDGTALMEFRTRKNIIYRIKGQTACTYDIDDTPPFPINRQALASAMEIALLLKTSLVGELHITRKQYLDGSIPTGFQRTAIVGIEGEIPLAGKAVGIRQLSIEEDSCREVSDIGHERIYSTDRLGMPLVETVTEPELLTPTEAAEAANHLRYLARSTGKVNVGIGAARQDVNVSIEGGTRVEIKGVQHIRWIPELTHNEAFRQQALLLIRDELACRITSPDGWAITGARVDPAALREIDHKADDAEAAAVIRLPQFAGLLSFFTNPGRCFADELSDRLKVIACIDKPNLAYRELSERASLQEPWNALAKKVDAHSGDAVVLIWGPEDDIQTAMETVEERCQLAFAGVPNETRKALRDGTTLFERVLPGPDRMYPDTDSAPIPIDETMIEQARAACPEAISDTLERLHAWNVPEDAKPYLLRRNLVPLLDALIKLHNLPAGFAATLLGHTVRHAAADAQVNTERISWAVEEVTRRHLTYDILRSVVPAALADEDATFDDILRRIEYTSIEPAEIDRRIMALLSEEAANASDPRATRDRIMGALRPLALGNIPLSDVAKRVEEGLR